MTADKQNHHSIGQLLTSAEKQLKYCSDSSALDAELLMMAVLNCQRSYLYTWPEKPLNKQQNQRFDDFITRRIAAEPVAYIIGRQGFWTLQLQVTEATLIPRPETELLVEAALNLPLTNNAKVLDLGTGSGAIALALAAERPSWQVTAVDSSLDALQVASSNAQHLNLQRVNFLQSDWFQNLPEHWLNEPFDLVISNPPYIDRSDPCLQNLKYEPLAALVANNSGMADLQLIIEQSPAYLKEQGYLLLEHGNDHQQMLADLLKAQGYQNLILLKDLNNQPRVSGGQTHADSC